MNRNHIIVAATAVVFAVLIGVLLASLPEQSEPTTAAVQALPAETEVTDASPAKVEEPAVVVEEPVVVVEELAVVETPVAPSDAEPAELPPQPMASAELALENAAVPQPAPEPVPEVAAAPEPAPEAKPTAVVELVPPGFDIVRVETTGETVLAGRAMVGSMVSVLDGGTSIGEVAVDGRGQWAFVVDKPLAPGSHELSLEARLADGRVITSTDVVVINVPRPQVAIAPQASPEPPAAGAAATETASASTPASESALPAASTADPARATDTGTKLASKITVAEQPLVVLLPRSGEGASQVLQQSTTPREGLAEGTLVLETIDYDEAGAVIGGRAEPGAQLIVYLDDSPLGETVAGSNGRWSLELDRPLSIGLHRMRVDVIDAQGKVIARVETPFSRAILAELLPDETSVVVQPGNSLWRIARRVYGKGVRYTVIYEANQGQIREADLIYPGQIFKVPMTIPAVVPAAN